LDLVKDEFTASFSRGHAVNPQVITRRESKAAGAVADDCVQGSFPMQKGRTF
jgi:hypothetical protein